MTRRLITERLHTLQIPCILFFLTISLLCTRHVLAHEDLMIHFPVNLFTKTRVMHRHITSTSSKQLVASTQPPLPHTLSEHLARLDYGSNAEYYGAHSEDISVVWPIASAGHCTRTTPRQALPIKALERFTLRRLKEFRESR